MPRKLIFCLVLLSFIADMACSYGVSAQTLNLHAPGELLPQSRDYSLPILKGLKLDPRDPLKIDFIIDTANQGKVSKEEADAKVVQSLYQKALKGDVTACIFWLKNRQPRPGRSRPPSLQIWRGGCRWPEPHRPGEVPPSHSRASGHHLL